MLSQVCAAAAIATCTLLAAGTPARQCLPLLYAAMESHGEQGQHASPQSLQVRMSLKSLHPPNFKDAIP